MLSPNHGDASTEPPEPNDEFTAQLSRHQQEQKSTELSSQSNRQHDPPPPPPPPPSQNAEPTAQGDLPVHATPAITSIDKPNPSLPASEQAGPAGQVYDTGLSAQWPQQQPQLSHQTQQQYQRPQQQHLSAGVSDSQQHSLQTANNQMRLFMGQNYVPNSASQQHLYSQPSAVVSPVHAAVGPSGIVTAATFHQPSLSHSSFFDLGATTGNTSSHEATASPTLLMDMAQFAQTDYSTQQQLQQQPQPQQQQRDASYDMYPLQFQQQQHQQPQQPATTKSLQENSRMSFPSQHIQPSASHSHHHHQYNPSFRHSITLPLTHVPYLQQQQQQPHQQQLVTSSMMYDPITVTDLSRDGSAYIGTYAGGGSTSPTNLVKRKNLYDQSMQTAKRLKLDEGISVSMPPTPMHEHRPGPLLGNQLPSQPTINMQNSRHQPLPIVPPSMPTTSGPGKQRSAAWTRSEEDKLQVLVDAGVKWSEITREFPNRSAGAIKKHFYADMRNTSWNDEDDSLLRAAVKEDEDHKWRRISEKVGKPAKACEKRMRELNVD